MFVCGYECAWCSVLDIIQIVLKFKCVAIKFLNTLSFYFIYIYIYIYAVFWIIFAK